MSNPSIVYTTLLYADGTASCNCPGWTRRVDKETGSRTCKHIISAGYAPVSVSVPASGAKGWLPAPKGKGAGKHGAPAQPTMRVTRKFNFDED